MKILNVQKNNNCQKVKLFGIPVCYSKIKPQGMYIFKFLYGLYTYKRTDTYKKIKILGITILKIKNKVLQAKITKNIPSSPLVFPENKSIKRLKIIQMAKKLLSYDVVSFDIFDTLIFRALAQPTDLFALLEQQVNIPEFKKYRIQAEAIARAQSTSNEVTIFQIYDELAKFITIDKQHIIEMEFGLECKFCYANPYFLEIFNILKKNSKRIIAISNMYWPEEYLSKLLCFCGYDGFDKIFISCDFHVGKGKNGILYDIAKKDYNISNIIHIGDNYTADFINAKAHGFEAYHYPNCTFVAEKYRPKREFSMASSIHKALVANTFYNGYKINFDRFYQFGFTYGGILAYGFCEYLSSYCKKNNIDKILFLARGCDIIHKVYNKYFTPIKNDYVLWSRFVGTQINLKNSVEELITRNVNPFFDFTKQAKIKELFININCEFLLDESDLDFNKEDVLTKDNIEKIKNFIRKKEDIIKDHFSYLGNIAKEYFYPLIKDCKNICIVDEGWSGKSIFMLRNYLKNELQFSGEILSCMMGAYNREFTNIEINNQNMDAWLFSAYKNKDLLTKFEKNIFNETIFIETLFTSNMPSFLSLTSNKELSFAWPLVENNEYINQIHKGIIDFITLYQKFAKDFSFTVQANDAFSNIDHFSKYNNLIKYTFNNYAFNLISGYANTGIVNNIIKIIKGVR